MDTYKNNGAAQRLQEWAVTGTGDIGYCAGNAAFANDVVSLVEECEERGAVIAKFRAAKIAYASEFAMNADGEPDVDSIHANIRALKLAATQQASTPANSAIHDAIEDISALLTEVHQFKSTSPQAQQNINSALDLLQEIDRIASLAAPGLLAHLDTADKMREYVLAGDQGERDSLLREWDEAIRNAPAKRVPKWIDMLKGSDPTIDSLIEYIENITPYAQPATDQQAAESIDLTPVINWLEAGCNPKEAAKELRIHQQRIDRRPAAAPSPEAQPIAEPEFSDDEKALLDATMFGTGVTLGGKHIPYAEIHGAQPIADNQAGTWLNDEQVLAVDQAMRLSIACGNDSLSERLSDIIGDRNFTKATKYPPVAQPIADMSAHKFEKVKHIAYFRKASEYDPWIECELSDPDGLRFTSMEDRPLGTGAADVSASTDEQIIAACHSVGIDTEPSVYGFDALQVKTSVPGIRTIIHALAASAAAPVSGQAATDLHAAILALTAKLPNYHTSIQNGAYLDGYFDARAAAASLAASSAMPSAVPSTAAVSDIDALQMLEPFDLKVQADTKIAVVRAILAASGQPEQVIPEGWISVDERLPDEGADVLAYWTPYNGLNARGACFGAATYAGSMGWHEPEDEEDSLSNPTHWMPLPAAPSTGGAA